MLSEGKIERINALANKSKKEGLTDKEREEQKNLREEYLQSLRSSFRNQLKSVKVVDPEGTDVTPEKLKQEKENDKKH
ncbi:hypothetical protein CEY16_02830 [Halalkalibacillus sediminis]|uniref:UPF0291 protein CEY16_02830 n=1 Tax=Halalkalibacillus sediminis TaxID=2018042 RepID=A0A2I0QWL6_9BACI|nr:DUF896 domain-containing protein [Halalkalibacillus sediminis]PKR78708.1 hypothetical protein CEY16_02830 [Halalkalibacillus sediminis]